MKKKDDDEKKDLVVAACRTDNTICMWGVGENGLEEVEGGKQKVVDGFEVYGSCVYKSKKSGKQYGKKFHGIKIWKTLISKYKY